MRRFCPERERETFYRTRAQHGQTPTAPYKGGPMIFAPTELAFVDLDGLVRTADLLTAALHVHQHRLSSEQAPCRDCIGNEAMILCVKWADTRRTISYVRYIISCKVSPLCWNYEPCLIDFVSEHITAALLRYRYPKPSFALGSAHQVISRPQVLHGITGQISKSGTRNPPSE